MSKFPVEGLLPKAETQATQFLTKYPEYDGRGVVIAILDTGIDPAAPGLQKTSLGTPKIVDIIDCTGSGDVALTEGEVDGESFLKGASGRRLKLNPSWQNPSGEYRVGYKRAYELYPKDLLTRLQADHRKKFEVDHSRLVILALEELSEWNKNHTDSAVLTEVDLEMKANLENKISCLTDLLKNYEDYGPLLDCVAFHDGKTYRVAIDLEESGDLTNSTLFADYKLERQYAHFGKEDCLTFSVKFYDEGQTLSIVTNAGSHATHVAAITAANFPEEPALNGLAPGAQLISLKIGDTRLGSMETGQGLTRALGAMLNSECKLANMSYGEDAALCTGSWIELLQEELINKSNVVFVSSAGNAGPAISTVGAPGGVTEGCISVGAYATADMVASEYALTDQVPENAFTWSSRGPALNGSKGVSVYAPGAAVTSVPQYQLKHGQLMNGTSMSSPNACGNIALLISALCQKNIPFTPFAIKKVIENTSKDIKDQLMVGFLQIEDAYNYMLKYHDCVDTKIMYRVTTGNNQQGIYLREQYDSSYSHSIGVSVNAVFKLDDNEQQDDKLNLEQRLSLVGTQSWIKPPKFLLFNAGGRDFSVQVDSQLGSGLHYGEVQAFDTQNVRKGPVFRIPVTVIKPSSLIEGFKFMFNNIYTPGHIDRQFVQVPVGATWAEMKLVVLGEQQNKAKIVVHLMQSIPQTRHSRTESHWYFNIGGQDNEIVKKFAVRSGLTLEICTAQFWSSLGTFQVHFDFEFHGIETQDVKLVGANGFGRIDMFSPFRSENYGLALQLKNYRKSLSPFDAQVQTLHSRDTVGDIKVGALLLTYKLEASENVEVTFRTPVADDMVYETQFDGVLILVTDKNKKMLQFGDVYRKQIKLSKGEYTIQLQLRHKHAEVLDKFKNLYLIAEVKLSKSINLDLYSTLPSMAFKGSGALKSTKGSIVKGQSTTYFVDTKIEVPKEVKPGDVLTGDFNVFSDSIEHGQYFLELVVPSDVAVKEDDKLKSTQPQVEQMKKAVLDLQLGWLAKFTNDKDKQILIEDLKSQHPGNLKLQVALLEHQLSQCKSYQDLVSVSGQIIVTCKQLLSSIDEYHILAALNAKAPQVKTVETKLASQELEEKKKLLTSIRFRLVEALLVQYVKQNLSNDNLEDAWSAYWSYYDASQVKNVFIAVARERLSGRTGTALSILNKFISENEYQSISESKAFSFVGVFNDRQQDADKDEFKNVYALREEVLEDLKWQVWLKLEKRAKYVRYPPKAMTF